MLVFYLIKKTKKKETIFLFQKIIISCVNYWTLHVKQPDIASGVRLETKPLQGRVVQRWVKITQG